MRVLSCYRYKGYLKRLSIPVLFTWLYLAQGSHAFNSFSARAFTFTPQQTRDGPKLILISGCTGTGKSTFGMSVALDQKILKCISTDTVRAVMRSFIGEDISPALHRSSYSRGRGSNDDEDDPILSWRETCRVLQASVNGLVDDAIARGVSLVVEGVHVVPSDELIQRWEEKTDGTAVGCLLTIRDEDAHRRLLEKRGIMTGKGEQERKKLDSFGRVRAIQAEMIRLAEESNWELIEQKLEPDPLEIVNARLDKIDFGNNKNAKCAEEALGGRDTANSTADNSIQP